MNIGLLLQMIKQGQNPQQLILSYLNNQFSGSPVGANISNLIQNNKQGELEQMARNMCAAKGMDYDQAFNAFMKQYGLK